MTTKYNARILSKLAAPSKLSGAINGTVECTLSATYQEAAAKAQQTADRLGKRVWLSLMGSDTQQFSPS